VRAVILTCGDPDALTGGSLYHRRIAARASRTGVEIDVRPLDHGDDPTAIASDADVVVVDSIVASRVRPSRFGVPVVASVHQRPGGLTGASLARMVGARQDLRCYRAARAVVAPSTFLAAVLERGGVPPERIRVVPPGRDMPAEGAGRRSGDRRDAPGTSFVCVSNLSPHKRPLDLLEAFASLDDPAATLTLVGGARDARLTDRVRSRLRRPDLAGRATWVGPLAPEAVAERLGRSDVFVLPALDEAYGMAVAEALGLGLPAIVARSGNLPAIVSDGVDGIVVAPRDTAALAGAMRRFARDPELRNWMSAAARAGAKRFPTWDETARRFAATLVEVQAAVAERDADAPSSSR